MQISTGYETEDYSGGESPIGAKSMPKKMKTIYPEITLRDDAAKQIMAACEPDQTFTATVTFKCVGTRRRAASSSNGNNYPGESGDSVELEIQGIEMEGGDEETAPDETAESAVDSYRNSRMSGGEEMD